LLREPDNHFGPPTGQGYDYAGAGLNVTALALAALSVWCRLAIESDTAALWPSRGVRMLLAAPSYVSGWFFWPFHLYVACVTAATVWYATLHTAAYLTRFRRCGRVARTCSAVVAVIGWAVGFAVALAK